MFKNLCLNHPVPYPDITWYSLNGMDIQTNPPKLWARCWICLNRNRIICRLRVMLLWTNLRCSILYHIFFVTSSTVAILILNKYHFVLFLKEKMEKMLRFLTSESAFCSNLELSKSNFFLSVFTILCKSQCMLK